MRLLSAVAIAVLAGCAASEPPPQEAAAQQSLEDGDFRFAASIDRVQVSAAESIQLHLTADYPEDASLALPEVGEQLGEFLVEDQADAQPILIAGDLLSVGRSISLAPVAPGEFEVPALTARVTLADGRALLLTTDPVPVVISSVLPEVDAAEPTQLRDIQQPLDPPIPLSWKVGGALALALAIAGIVWFRRRSRREPELEPEPEIPPGRSALARLDALSAKGLLDAGQHQEYHFELSDILREYIERRFSLRAQEQTTDEFLAGLPQHRIFTPQQQALLHDFLMRADLVKFAKYAPRAEQSMEAAEACRRFIVETDRDEDVPFSESRMGEAVR